MVKFGGGGVLEPQNFEIFEILSKTLYKNYVNLENISRDCSKIKVYHVPST